MELYIKQNINDNMVQYVFMSNDNTLHGICVQKDISIEDAYNQMINYKESDETIIE